MANEAANVVVAATGAVYRAPTGTTLPTSADAEVGSEFGDLGYISEDGVAETIDEQVTTITAWQNADVVRKIQTSHDVTYAFTALETNAEVLETFYGHHVAGVTEVRGTPGVRGVWVLDFIDGDTRHVRVVLPDAQVTARGQVTHNRQGPASYPITLTAYPDTEGVKAYIYVDETPGSS